MSIIKRGESGKASITAYYDTLKLDNWKGNTRNINAPFLGPTGRRKHLHGAAILGGLYLLGQFRSTEPRLFTAGKYAVAPILGSTIAGKIANTAIDVLRAGQQLGAIPMELTNNYPDIPVTLNPLERIKSIFATDPSNINEVRKKYGLNYGSDKSYADDLGETSNPDLVPVKFKTNTKTIPVRGAITALSDSVTPTWNETMYVGRPQGVVTYGGFSRELAFDLTLTAVNPGQLRPMWHKINDLAKLVLPQSDVDSTRFAGRLCELTIGSYIQEQLCVVTGFTISPSEEAYWEIMDPDVHHPSLTLDPSIGKKLQTHVKRKIDEGRNKAALLPGATDKQKSRAPGALPMTTKERKAIHEGGDYERFIMPRVCTISFGIKVLHNSVPGTDEGPQLFDVSAKPGAPVPISPDAQKAIDIVTKNI